MTQPEIGLKIAELRRQAGKTQEELAWEAGLNVRSIQRIESGEVEPRLSTLKNIGDILEFDFNEGQPGATDFWLLLMHISSILPIVLIPLFIWAWKKEENPYIREKGPEIINFQISMTIYLFAAAMLVFVVIGIVILPILGVFIFFVTIINTIKAAMSQDYSYPLCIRFINPD